MTDDIRPSDLGDLLAEWPAPADGSSRIRQIHIRRRRRAVAGRAFVAVAVVASGFGAVTHLHHSGEDDHAPATAIQTGPWRRIAPAGLPAGASTGVWTGSEMLVVGGFGDGPYSPENLRPLACAAYDPVHDRWRRIADLPADLGDGPGVWTGNELIVGGGRFIPPNGTADGAAYDLATDRWTPLPASPIPWRDGASMVWTGREVIIWGGQATGSTDGTADGAAYDPARRRWRRLARAPLAPRSNPSAVWTGREMVLFGGVAGDGGHSRSFADGAAYDPVHDRWRRIAPAPIPDPEARALGWTGRRAAIAAWTGHGVLVWGGVNGGTTDSQEALDGAIYDPVADRWSLVSPAPLRAGSDANGVWDGSRLVVWEGDGGAQYDVAENKWTAIPPAPIKGRSGAVVLWTGDRMIVWGGEGGSDGATYQP